MIHAGHEPRLPRQHAHLGGEERRPRVARLEPVDRLGEVAEQFGLIDVKEFQQQADVIARLLEQFDEPVLDLDVVVGLREAEARCPFQGTLARGVQLADETLEIKSGHDGRALIGAWSTRGREKPQRAVYRLSTQESMTQNVA
jgi:hypothetical protein